MVKDGKVFTPKGMDILRGITRNYILKLCNELRIPIIETDIEPFDLYNADEAFLTSTPFCILPAVTLNKLKIGDGRPGKITNMLLKKWSENVKIDIVKQIKKWDQEIKTSEGTTPYKFNNSDEN